MPNPALPIRELVLYKHGVGFFVRSGPYTGDRLTLDFTARDINDVLKSLVIFDRAAGSASAQQVLGISYDTPVDVDERAAGSSIRLDENSSLHDLLRSLRGRRVRVRVQIDTDSSELVSGTMIGLDRDRLDDERVSTRFLLLDDDGQTRVLRLYQLRSLEIIDAQAQADLSYMLDLGEARSHRRQINVRLTPGAHDLSVYYVAPSPTWRVSYRLVAAPDDAAAAGTVPTPGAASTTQKGIGRALLQGWGLLDNRLDEDLDNVQVTLVAGQPVSFVYDLYDSRIPQRRVVQDEARVAPGPVEYAARAGDRPAAPSAKRRAPTRGAFAMNDAAAAPQPDALYSMAAMVDEEAPVYSETRETGETFQYRVTAPVSVKRGESALVPILSAMLRYERELLYNAAKLPDHPVAALRFDNDSGLTLERGPVTVIEEGSYRGDAVLPLTRSGGSVYLPFAVELGVRVYESVEEHSETAGLSLRGVALVFEQYRVRSTVYRVENNTDRDQIITVEAAVTPNWTLYDTEPPAVETAAYRRWPVPVAARGEAVFVRTERQQVFSRTQITDLTRHKLRGYFDERWLDEETFNALDPLLQRIEAREAAQKRLKDLNVQRDEQFARQENTRKNLAALSSSDADSPEAALRQRTLNELEASVDALEDIEAEMNELRIGLERVSDEIETMLDALTRAE